MKTTQQIASARTPDGETLALLEHDGEYSIQVGRQELMTSRAHESELELARLGCAQIRARPRPTVLVGGLGMGYTLRGALDALPGGATVVVGELMPEIVEWNRRYFGALSGHPLKDRRVQVRLGDVHAELARAPRAFDAILLDVDNGPEAFTAASNDRLYGAEGLALCLRALRRGGCLAIWSVGADPAFEKRLQRARYAFRRIAVPAYEGARTLSRTVWCIAESEDALPPARANAASARSR